MSMSLKLAWRSLVRHKRRSAITGGAVALSLAMMIFFVGVADDSHARMAELGIHMGQGHVLVQGAGYQAEQTLDHLVTDPKMVREVARKLPGVTHVVPRVRTGGLLTAGDRSAPVLLSGVDPSLEPRVSSIASAKKRKSGEYLRSPSQMPYRNMPLDIYLGAELADALEVKVGDRVVLMVSPVGSARPAQGAFVVRGVFRTGVLELDQSWAEVPITEAQRLLRLEGQVTQMAVLLSELGQSTRVANMLRGRLPMEDLEVLTWYEALRELADAIALDDGSMYVMMGIIFIIVAIGIFNTVLMSVIERTREFGVMMALGCKPGRLAAVVMAEGTLLALLASLVGVGLGLALHAYMARYGFDITAYAQDYQISGIVFEGRIYSRLSAAVVVRWTLVVISMTILSSLYPALRAARLRPLEAIHHV